MQEVQKTTVQLFFVQSWRQTKIFMFSGDSELRSHSSGTVVAFYSPPH